MKQQRNLYIPSIEAKDIVGAQHYFNCSNEENTQGYSLLNMTNEYNLKKFKNSFDFSLDLIELKTVIKQLYPDTKDFFSFKRVGKIYSDKIINVTFKFSYKEFNKIAKNMYVKAGYNAKKIAFDDCIALFDNEIIGITTDEAVKDVEKAKLLELPKGFVLKECNGIYQYKTIESLKKNKKKENSDEEINESGNIRTLIDSTSLRKKLYKDGFICNGLKYVRFKRSSGSARVGKCLFIEEGLYKFMHESEKCGLTYEEGDEIDLAAIEAYIALTSSSIIDTLDIKPENILVIDDYTSVFKEVAVVTESDEDGNLYTTQKEVEISNSIWDGQSLIDISLLGDKFCKKGMVLLRNKFFKSCCFNTNIQKWFKDNNITDISQLNGQTIAENIEDIKLITTPSSIKYFKFGKFEDWLKNIYPIFGVVKYDKNTHFFGGEMVQAHYQLINTLQLSEDDIDELVAPALNYIKMLETDMDVFRYHLKCNVQNEGNISSNIMKNTNEIVYKMITLDNDFSKTELFYKFKKELRTSYLNNMKKGHLLINGTYATLFGNPLEMLKQSIGLFDAEHSSIPVGCVHNTRYPYGTDILGCRSPHVTMGNILIAKNIAAPEIDTYFNLTPQIICLNSINENSLERLSGADFDSDQMIITNNPILIRAAKINYEMFKVPTSNVHASKTVRHYTKEDLADLDVKTGKNKIGEIINLSQELNSIIWNKIYQISNENKHREKEGLPLIDIFEEIKDIYFDVCQLDVMSCIEIDKAKKEFKVDNTKELNKLRLKYKDLLMCEDDSDGNLKRMKPKFLGYIASTKGFYDTQKHMYIYQNTAMDYLYRKLSKFRIKRKNVEFVDFSSLFKPIDYSSKSVNYKQIHDIIDYIRDTQTKIKNVWATESSLLSGKEKAETVKEFKEDVCNYINEKTLNESTLYKLVSLIDSKEYSDISRFLMTTLFNYKNEQLTECLKNQDKVRTYIMPDINGDVEIYGKMYTRYSIG